MPLQKIHRLALISVEAARCAGEQGKFWEYHDLLYGHQDQPGQERHKSLSGISVRSEMTKQLSRMAIRL